MKKFIPLVIMLALTGCLFTPRWITHGNVSVYVPPGFAHTVEQDGSMMVSMAETSAYVSIQKVSSDNAFREKVKRSIKLARGAYGENQVVVSEITSLGKLKGQGFVITIKDQRGTDSKNDETWFLTDQPNTWMISAGCSSGNSGVWTAYRQILESLKLR